VILLDTHALVWWVATPARIPVNARRLLDATIDSGGSVAASSISIWEVAMLVERGRLELSMPVDDWISHLEALPFLQFVPVDNRIAVRAVTLEKFPHRDPADRIIVATALGLGASLITADARLRAYRRLTTVWA
jgi:PIN domain nuclease of toxin-antitoxin system